MNHYKIQYKSPYGNGNTVVNAECKRDAMIAFKHGIEYINNHYDVKLEYEPQTCEFHSMNQQCIKEKCPFYEWKRYSTRL